MFAVRAACLAVLGVACAHGAFAAGDCATPYSISQSTVSFNNQDLIGNPFSASSSNGDITITGATLSACMGTMSLTAANALTEDVASSLTAGTLTGQSGGNTSLMGTNQVGTLGVFLSSGSFAFTNTLPIIQAGALTVASTSSFNASGHPIMLSNSGNHFTGEVTGSGTDISITNGNNLGIASINAGGNFTLNVTGGISQTGAIIASTLTGSATGNVTLNNGVNQIASLGAFTANDFALSNAQTLTVTGAVNAAGALTLGASVVNAGNLTFGNSSTVGSVVGNYSQTGTLTLHATATGNDQLAISGIAGLGGTLSVAFSTPPTNGQSFNVLTATSIDGTFGTVNVTGLAAMQSASASYNASNVVLTINATTPVTLQSFEVN